MIFSKLFLRIILFAILLSSLLILLGVKYHWGERLNKTATRSDSAEMQSPVSLEQSKKSGLARAFSENDVSLQVLQQVQQIQPFNPVIIETKNSISVLDSMTKQHITEECLTLLDTQKVDKKMLDLVLVHWIMSNYQESYEDSQYKLAASIQSVELSKRALLKASCQQKIKTQNQYTIIQKELLMGMCVSDQLNH